MPAQKFADKHSLKILNMEPATIPPNNSHQHLVQDYIDNGDSPRTGASGRSGSSVTAYQWCTVLILCFVNLINYMDRYTIAGVLTDIKSDLNLTEAEAGLLQTAFIVSYMLFAPIFGYLGDRYSRRWIMAFGVGLWSLTTMAGSFMSSYWPFLFFRAMVGIGEASYSTIAPTIVSDLFIHNARSNMLALFYFAIPVGSGLGYIVGSETAHYFGGWQWALRVTPFLGVLAVILIIFVLEDPVRGESEGRSHSRAGSWASDLKHIRSNKSLLLCTLGFTCVAFVTGALAWWGPHFIYLGFRSIPGNEDITVAKVSFTFGAITMVSGLMGVPMGAIIAQRLRVHFPRADPLVCATGLILSAPLVCTAIYTVNHHAAVTYTLIFFGELCLNLNWSVVADILLYVVPPTKRSTAEAFQILVSHMFGDAGSPYLIGVMAGILQARLATSSFSDDEIEFHSLQYSLYIMGFVEVLGGIFFLLNAVYVLDDRKEAEREITGVDNPVVVPTHLYADD